MLMIKLNITETGWVDEGDLETKMEKNEKILES